MRINIVTRSYIKKPRLLSTGSTPNIQLYRDNPTRCVRELFCFHPWEKQEEIINLVKNHDRVAICSCNKMGKTSCLSALSLWWIITHYPAKVIITAPTAKQLKQIWNEMRSMITKNGRLKNKGLQIKNIKANEMPGAGIKLSSEGCEDNVIIGFTSDSQEGFQGTSSPNLLVVVDEASGIKNEIFEAIDGMVAAKTSKLVIIGNPTQNVGYFYDAFHTKQNLWKTLNVSAMEVPNIKYPTKKTKQIDGLASPEWVEREKINHGFPSAWIDIHVLGQFTAQENNSVIPIELIEKALSNKNELKSNNGCNQLHVGVDVGRHADPTICTIVRNNYVYSPMVIKKTNFVDQIGKILEEVERRKQIGDKKPIFTIDGGGMGEGFNDILEKVPQEIRDQFVLNSVNFGSKAIQEDKYPNKRCEIWFCMLEWFKLEDRCLPANQELLISELQAPTYTYDLKQRRVVLPKEEIKKLIGRSCDYADSLGLAVYPMMRGNLYPDINKVAENWLGNTKPLDLKTSPNIKENTKKLYDYNPEETLTNEENNLSWLSSLQPNSNNKIKSSIPSKK